GCVMYTSLAGRPPFAANDELAIWAKILLEDPTPLVQVRPEVPHALSLLVRRLLEKSPAHRPASAHAVAEELRRLELADGEGVTGGRVGVAAGRGVLGGSGTLGEALERGASLLRGAALGGGRGGAIAVDEVTAGLLGTRFAIERRRAPAGAEVAWVDREIAGD